MNAKRYVFVNIVYGHCHQFIPLHSSNLSLIDTERELKNFSATSRQLVPKPSVLHSPPSLLHPHLHPHHHISIQNSGSFRNEISSDFI